MVEEHNGYGGLGSATAEVMAGAESSKPLLRLHLPELLSEYGSQEYLRRHYGLDADSIAEKIRKLI